MITPPSAATLKKYGLSLAEWWAFIPKRYCPACCHQTKYAGSTPCLECLGVGFLRVCPICGQPPKTGRMVVDHHHVRGWKEMSPSERKKYVRGVVCTTCNHFILTRYGTPLKHRNAADYLEHYEGRTKWPQK